MSGAKQTTTTRGSRGDIPASARHHTATKLGKGVEEGTDSGGKYSRRILFQPKGRR